MKIRIAPVSRGVEFFCCSPIIMLLPECLNAEVTQSSKTLLLIKEAEQHSEQWQIHILIKKKCYFMIRNNIMYNVETTLSTDFIIFK